MGESLFRREARKAFAFLESEFAFAAPTSSSGIVENLVFLNDTTGVVLSSDRDGLSVRFARLIDGKLPKVPLYVSEVGDMHWFYLEDLIDLKVPGDSAQVKPTAAVKSWLRGAAVLTRRLADRVLKGDFSEFPALAKLVRERAQSIDEAYHPRYYRLRKSMGHWKLGDP
jgi:hypothetical protein